MGSRARFQSANGPDFTDTTPLEIPLGACRPTPLHDLIARMVRDQMQSESDEEFESIEAADDFEEEDPDVLDFSRYELSEATEEYPIEQETAPPKKRTPKEVLDEAYGEGNYPPEWANGETGDRPDLNDEEPS